VKPIEAGTPRGVLLRDFVIFQSKLVVDGLKDVALFQLACFVFVVEIAFGGSRRGRTFYALMRAGESFDRWLNLHGALSRGTGKGEGLFGGSEPGDGTLVGEIEGLVARR
jgi:hypothetical protein